MSWKTPLLVIAVLAGAGALIFHFFQRQLAGSSIALGTPPEVLVELKEALDDRRTLARLDPERESVYRERFERLEQTVHRLQILEHNRAEMVRRYELLLLAIFAASIIGATGIYVFRQSRHTPRLARLQEALTDLANGRTDLALGDRGRDTIGRIAAMIERTSRVMAHDRRRLKTLDNLSAWQEAARRHAHEMRTPLTGAKLEIERMDRLLASESLERQAEVDRARDGVVQELDRLGEFTRRFTSFARLPRPRLLRTDLGSLVGEFIETYSSAWPNLELRLETSGGAGYEAAIDRDMLRQVLVNLCDNSSLALGERAGHVVFSLDADEDGIHLAVADDGPGIAASVETRLFEPYTTTRTIGAGMGLGLAISKKILLDHGGDLELVDSSKGGATFRLTLPVARS